MFYLNKDYQSWRKKNIQKIFKIEDWFCALNIATLYSKLSDHLTTYIDDSTGCPFSISTFVVPNAISFQFGVSHLLGALSNTIIATNASQATFTWTISTFSGVSAARVTTVAALRTTSGIASSSGGENIRHFVALLSGFIA